MKYLKIGALFVLGILLVYGCQSKKSQKQDETLKEIIITGEVIPGEGTTDEISIQFGSVIPFNRDFKVIKEVIKLDENYNFSFKGTSDRPVERIIFFSKRNHLHPSYKKIFNDGLSDYFISPGDSLHITIDHSDEETQYRFSGRGAAKFKARWEADHVIWGDQQDDIGSAYQKIVSSNESVAKKTEKYLNFSDSIIALQSKVIDGHEKHMNPLERELLRADIIGTTRSKYVSIDNNIQPESLTELESNAFKKLINRAYVSALSENAKALSPFYVDYLTRLAIAELIVGQPGNPSYHYTNIKVKHFSELCSLLRKRYSGLLREKLLVFNLQTLRTQDTYGIEECLQSSHSLIQNKDLKAYFDIMYSRKIRGTQGYNFSLPDTNENQVRLEDFKGKVVYLDIWFTGCGGCIHLAEEVDEKVYPKFKDNPDVVFVTISFDKDKQTWLKSVASERYGLKEYVNLYTEGLGIKHPFLEYYQVQGGPTTMLFDRQGRIFSAAPPKHDASNELIALINEALAY